MTAARVSTLDSKLPTAELCRANGWGPGSRLVGDEGYGPTVIEITAVGETDILATAVSYDGKPVGRSESIWILSCRDWQPHQSTKR